MLALYHDEDSLGAIVAALRRAGFDCRDAAEAGMRGRSDHDQLAFATDHGRALFTKNAGDFQRLDAAWRRDRRQHAGIIVLTDSRAPIGRQVRAMQELAESYDQGWLVGRLVFVLNYGRSA